MFGQQAGESEFLFPVGSLDDHLHLVDNGGAIVGYIADGELLGQATQDEVERVPDIESIDWYQWPVLDRGPVAQSLAADPILLGLDQNVELSGGVAEFSVVEELVNEVPPRVRIIIVGVRIDGLILFGQQQAAFDLHQGGCHNKELTGHFEAELLHGEEHLEVLFEDLLDRDVVDVDLRLSDQKEQKVEGALKDLEFDTMIRFSGHWEAGKN